MTNGRQDGSSDSDESDDKEDELEDWGSSRSLTGGGGWESHGPGSVE